MKRSFVLLLALVLLCSVTAAQAAYPIDNAPVTLTVYSINKVSNNVSDYNQTPFFQHLEEATGIHIEWEHPATAGLQESVNLLSLRDAMPDIILCGSLYNGGVFQGVEDGYFIDLAPYLPEYAPEYWNLITSSDESYRECANAQGVVPAFRIVKPVSDPPYQYLMFNTKMLADLGCELPVYLADYAPIFQKMLDNGITPYMPPKSGYEKSLMGMFDVKEGFHLNAEGEIVYGQVQEGFRQYLELMHDWYLKGFISKDFTASSSSNTNTLFDTSALGTYMGAVVAVYNRTQKVGFEAAAAPLARLYEGQQLHWYDYDMTSIIKHDEATAVITADCKNVEAAVQWLNYCYTEAGANLANWGTEGENYDVVDGQKVYNDLMQKNTSITNTNFYYKMHVWPKLNEPDVVCHADLLKTAGARASRMKWANETYFDSAYVLPALTLMEDDLSLRTEIMSDIDIYVNEMVIKFITGEADLATFDDFTAQVWEDGLQDVIDMMTTAYGQYMDIHAPTK